MSAVETPEAPLAEVDQLRPKGQSREYTMTWGTDSFVFTQKPLSYFGKIELFAVIGDALDQAMSGDDSLQLKNMIVAISEFMTSTEQMSFEQLALVDDFVQGVAKLLTYAPDLMKDCYCIFLGVPRPIRDWFKDLVERPYETDDKGERLNGSGLSDEEGNAILELFIDQNGKAIRDFFDRFGKTIGKFASKKTKDASVSSKPSRRTRPSTRKA